jgi:hypothetical protein
MIVVLALAGTVVLLLGVTLGDEYLFNGSLFDDAPGTPSSGPCKPSDFGVEKIAVSTENGYAHLTGNVVSHCAQASGVELRWTATHDDGTVAFSHTFWPASVSNIPAHSTYAIDYSETAPQGRFSSKVEPAVTKAW